MAKKKRSPAKNAKASPHIIRKLAILAAAALILIFLGSQSWIALKHSAYFRLKNVEFIDEHGPVRLPDPFAASGLRKGENIFSTNLASVHQKIVAEHPNLKNIRVYRALPDKIVIACSLRQGFCYVDAGTYHLVDRQGVVLQTGWSAGTRSGAGALPAIRGISVSRKPKPGDSIRGPEFERALAVIDAFYNARLAKTYPVFFIDVKDKNNTLLILGGVEVRLGEGDMPERIDILREVLRNVKGELKKVKYIDMRFKDPVVGQR